MCAKISNLPVTSREYKLMLNPGRFRDREDGSEEFWNILEKIVQDSKCECIKYVKEFERITWYMDTPDSDLSHHNYILRLRDETNGKERYKITLKYRNPDRYISAAKVVSSAGKSEDEFEEDILPPFSSKYSNSSSVKLKKLPDLNKFKYAVRLFPGLGELELGGKTRMEITNNFKAYEITRWLGALNFGNDVPVKACLNFWYKTDSYSGIPMIAEFSFDYDMQGYDSGEEFILEYFPVKTVTRAASIYRRLQKNRTFVASINAPKSKTDIAYNLI